MATNDNDRDRGLQGRGRDQREELDRALDAPSAERSEAGPSSFEVIRGSASRTEPSRSGEDAEDAEDVEANPPHTTTGKITAPKFGSAGSGGAELEPGPPRP